MVNRYAFSMIELIFAIVVIGITVISLPVMTEVNSKGLENALVQEVIFATSTVINQSTTYNWDEMDDGNSSLSKVISTGDCNSSTKLRIGHINGPNHRRCLDDTSVRPSTIGSDGGDLDDIDDLNGTTSPLFFTNGLAFVADAHGYKKNYTTTISVKYDDFGATTAASKNIKKITVLVKDTDGNNVTALSTFSANIGEADFFKDTY